MLFLGTALVLFVSSTFHSVACGSYPSSLSQQQTPAISRSRVDRRDDNSKASRALKPAISVLPSPAPDQDIGAYFDHIDIILNDTSNGSQLSDSESQLTSRNLVRSSDYLNSKWSDGQERYNISISKCVRFEEIIGTWTALDGTSKENATFTDLNNDLATHFTTMQDLSDHLKSRLLANTELAVTEAESYLNSTVCNYDQSNDTSQPGDNTPPVDSALPPMVHDELRKLHASGSSIHALDTKFMAMDGYWTGVLFSMGAGAAVGGSLYKGFYNRNATAHNVAITAFVAAGLIFTRGVIERLYMNGMLQYTEASIVGAFVSWFRQAAALGFSLQQQYLERVGSAQTDVCLDEIVVVSGAEGLQELSEPGAGIIELIPMGRC